MSQFSTNSSAERISSASSVQLGTPVLERQSRLPRFPADIQLQPTDPSEPPIDSKALWANGPVVLVAIRRPGCFLCRNVSALIQSHADEFKRLGATLVGVCKESVGVENFMQKVWKSPLYIDSECDVFRYLWNGQLARISMLGKSTLIKVHTILN